jgi:hypothetical protein
MLGRRQAYSFAPAVAQGSILATRSRLWLDKLDEVGVAIAQEKEASWQDGVVLLAKGVACCASGKAFSNEPQRHR